MSNRMGGTELLDLEPVVIDLDDVKGGVAVSHDALGRFSVGYSAIESSSAGTITAEASLLLPN